MIGYGSQGRAAALNLRDSGFPVTVGLRARSKSRRVALRDGLSPVTTVSRAVAEADIVMLAFPDHQHCRVFSRDIADNLRPGATLVFLHGLSVHFKLVTPPDHCDVILIAPHAPGTAVRERFLGERSVSAFYAILQNRSKRARTTIYELAAGLGFKRKNLIRSTFAEEAIGDIFGEQAVLCGGLAQLIKNGFEVLVNHGWKPENAYLEIAYQLDLIVQLIKQHGIEGMFRRISVAARYGSYINGPKIVGKSSRAAMEKAFARISSGTFVRDLAGLSDDDIERLNSQLGELSHPEFEKAARRFRK